MSCFKINRQGVLSQAAEPDTGSLDLLARIDVEPDRTIFAAARTMAAKHAGARTVILGASSPLVDPVRVTREVLEASRQEIAVELECWDGDRARELVDAGASKVILGDAALLRPSLVRDVAIEIGTESTYVAVDCHAAGPGCIEVLDSEGRPSGFDCSSWLEQLEVLGTNAVLLRPRSNVPSEGLLELVRARSCKVFIEREGWTPDLIQAIGADGVVVQGALGTRRHFDLVSGQVPRDIAG